MTIYNIKVKTVIFIGFAPIGTYYAITNNLYKYGIIGDLFAILVSLAGIIFGLCIVSLAITPFFENIQSRFKKKKK